MKKFAVIAHPLHQLNEKSKNSFWISKAQETFEVLEVRLTSSPIRAFPSIRKPFMLCTDASQPAIGAVLAQVQIGSERVVSYAFKSFSKADSQ